MASKTHRACASMAAWTAAGLQIGMLVSCPVYAAELQSLPLPTGSSGPGSARAEPHPYAPHVAEASHRFGIPERWIWSVMRAESGGRSRAGSPVGAMGLMQIMPRTWSMLAARYGLGSDPIEVRANIHGGAAYLRLMWDRYGDVGLMLAAYNAGPGRVDEYRSGLRRLPEETRSYVARLAPVLGAGAATANTNSAAAAVRSVPPASVFAVTRNRDGESAAFGRDVEHDEAEPARADGLGREPGEASDRLFVPL